jgi:PilZ domain
MITSERDENWQADGLTIYSHPFLPALMANCYVRTMPAEIVDGLPPAYENKRRSIRYKLDVPLRVILHKSDATLIRDGRGRELSDRGMCILVGVELRVGRAVDIEFTLPFSGEPIRVSSAVRNREGYRYGCEFIPEGQAERRDVARLRQALQILAAEKSS